MTNIELLQKIRQMQYAEAKIIAENIKIFKAMREALYRVIPR